MAYSVLSYSFEYLCYGSTAIINSFPLTVRGSTLDFRRQILTSNVDPRALRVKCTVYAYIIITNSPFLNVNHYFLEYVKNYILISGTTGSIISHTFYNFFYLTFSSKQCWPNVGKCGQLPSKHVTLVHCWFNVGPSSSTLAQHWTNNGPAYRVCLEGHASVMSCWWWIERGGGGEQSLLCDYTQYLKKRWHSVFFVVGASFRVCISYIIHQVYFPW